MRHICLALFFCVPLLLAGCDRSSSITKETSPSPPEPPPASAAATADSALPTDEQHEEPKSIDPAEPSEKPAQKEGHDADKAAKQPAPEPVSAKKPAPSPETVNVRGKEYPYCRTPSEEGCISRESPKQPPVWK